MPRERTVGWLLTRAFAVLAAIVVGSGAVELAVVLVENHTDSQLTNDVEPLRLANAHLRSVLDDAERGVRGFSLTGNAGMAAAYDLAASEYPVAVQELHQLGRASDTAAVNNQVEAADAWWAVATAERNADPRTGEAERKATDGAPLFDTFADANDDLELHLSTEAATLQRRSRALDWISVTVLALLTVVAGVAALVIASRTGRRITRPLAQVADMLNRRRGGDSLVRVGAVDGPAEICAVALAIDASADQAEAIRQNEEVLGRQRRDIRQLGYRIRARLSVAEALGEAVRGLAATLDADHVLIRMAPEPGSDRSGADAENWNSADADGENKAAAGRAKGAPWVGRDRRGGQRADAVRLASTKDEHTDGVLAALARCDTGWLRAGDVWLGDVPASGDNPATHVGHGPSEDEQAAWAELGGGSLLTVAVGDSEPCLGAITLVRAPGRTDFNVTELRLAEVVAYDLARGVQHGRLFEREQHLVSRLQALDTAKTDFMSTVSHELRTPLTSISGYLELLLDAEPGDLSDAQLRMLEVIGRNTKRLRELIEDILTLSKIESGDFRSEQGAVDLAQIIERGVAAISPAAAKASVGLHLDVRGPLPLTGDGVQLDRVLVNLLSNAVKFTTAEGTVTVRAERSGTTAILVVADTGMGIPEDEQPALFARFFRASNAIHQAIPGTGLGLAIVRTIVDNHDGTIEIQSAENVGTTVTVRLPIT